MARFNYRMQSVLNIKQKTEGQVKMEFAAAQSELNKQLDILDEYIKRKENYLLEAEELRNAESLKLQDILDNQYQQKAQNCIGYYASCCIEQSVQEHMAAAFHILADIADGGDIRCQRTRRYSRQQTQ